MGVTLDQSTLVLRPWGADMHEASTCRKDDDPATSVNDTKIFLLQLIDYIHTNMKSLIPHDQYEKLGFLYFTIALKEGYRVPLLITAITMLFIVRFLMHRSKRQLVPA